MYREAGARRRTFRTTPALARLCTRKCMLENWLPLGLKMGEIELVTAAKRCDDMLYSKNMSSKLVTKYHVYEKQYMHAV